MAVGPADAEDLYEDAPCGYVSAALDGTIVRVNRTFERLTGHDRASLVAARRFQDLLTPGGRIYHDTHYLPLLHMQGAVREIAAEVVRADGSRLPVLLNSVLRRDPEGDGGCIHTSVFDATDRRRYERELLAARQRAERLQRHATLMADASRVLDGAHGSEERARRVAELLADRAGVSVLVMAADPARVLARAGSRADDATLGAVTEAAVIGEATTEGDTVAAVPLRVGGRTLGALGVLRAAAGDGFDEGDLPLLADLADRVALAVETARLYEHQRDVALTLQRSMLGHELPDDPRCRLAAHYSPAVDTLEVGGDWYDAFALDADTIAIVMGDVVGRGLEAAATMGQLRSALRALAGTRAGPAGVLARLDAFVELTEVARSATVAYAELALAGGRLTYACAGHPPPMVLPAGGEPEFLWGGRSTPLGAYAPSELRGEAVVTLEPGTRMLLYTDGVVETRDRPIDEGMSQLLAAFGAHGTEPLPALLDTLSGELLAGAVADDRCMLAVELGRT